MYGESADTCSSVWKLHEDIQAVITACEADSRCPFTEFEVSENKLSFVFTGNGRHQQFIFNLSEDYPEHTVLIQSDTPNDVKTVNERIPVVFNQLARELYKEMDVPVKLNHTEVATLEQSAADIIVNDSDSSETYDSADDYHDSDGCDEDYYDNNDMMEEEEEYSMHPLLAQDMDMVRAMYGDRAMAHRLFGSIDNIDVELHLYLSFLDREIAKAWRVVKEEPVVIRLHLSLSSYLDGSEPRVEVFQQSQKEKFGIGSQLRKILERFIADSWKNLSNESVSAGYCKVSRLKKFTNLFQAKKKPVDMPNRVSSDDNVRPVDDILLAKLVDMGYNVDLARNALIITRNEIEEAVNLLISNADDLVDGKGKPRLMRQNSHPKGLKDKLRLRQLQKQFSAGASCSSDTPSFVDDLNLLASSTKSGKNAKQIPSLEYGYLVQVMRYARQRLPTLNEYCVICDEPHVFQNGAMLKPAVCARELCVFAFQTLGVMSDAAEDIATGAEVVDLLIAMASAACRSGRNNVIFDPYPTVVDPLNHKELALSPKKKDFQKVERVLDAFPTMLEMTQLVGAELKKEMDRRNILAYPLLQWIITSNRSHIVKLPPEKQISFMHTPHQFLLMSSPPAKEAVFRAAKEQHGSKLAFHGSHIENWHSIMRFGLINASGTRYQMHGAAYGTGIYLSPQASISFGYSAMGYGHMPSVYPLGYRTGSTRFLKSKNLTCIALCEVIDCSELKKNNTIWVMPNPDYVCTRLFFVYEDGQVGDSNINTELEKYAKEIKKAVSFQTK